MKKNLVLILLVFFMSASLTFGQDYKEWDDHDVVRFYEKIDLDSYTLDDEGEEINEVYVPTKVEDGNYEVEVYKISALLYRIQDTNIYMFFRYSPYLYSYDDGILEVSYNSGTFYEKP
ncbi:MAG TPA: hypothetical protein VFC65_17055 [Prolixibacteraceae bacterium]|nr:hypothetical protein [Prolixibacteraceae bacterium]